MKRSRVYSLGGTMLLITSGAYLMVYALDPFELGDEMRSPVGAVLCVLGVAAAAGLIAVAIVMRRREKLEKSGRFGQPRAEHRSRTDA